MKYTRSPLNEMFSRLAKTMNGLDEAMVNLGKTMDKLEDAGLYDGLGLDFSDAHVCMYMATVALNHIKYQKEQMLKLRENDQCQ